MRAAAVALLGALVLGVSSADASPALLRPVVLRWLQMVDGTRGYALSGAAPQAYRLLRTGDGGRRWLDITPDGGRVHPSGPVAVTGADTLVLAAQLRPRTFAVLRSGDGGRSWRRSLTFEDPRGLGIGRPGVVDARHLYVAVDEGAAAGSQAQSLYASADGGHSWRFVSRTTTSGEPGTLPFSCDKTGFGFATVDRVFAGGYCAGGRAFLYRSDDGGRRWRLQQLPGLRTCACRVSPPHFFTARSGVLDAGGYTMGGQPFVRVYWTSDGGVHWRGGRVSAGRTSGAVSVASARVAWLVSGPPAVLQRRFTRLYRTVDAGRRWRSLVLPFNADDYQLDALDGRRAFALPPRDALLRTRDGGRTWQTIRTYRVAR